MGSASFGSGWTVLEWSREHGRGAIRSAQLGRLEFDAHCADVDDFEIGEPVQVELRQEASGFRVTRIWPANLRLAGTASEAELAPPIDARIEEAARAQTAGRTPSLDYRIKLLDEDRLILEGDDSGFEHGHADEIEILGPSYLELPVRFGCQFFRLATGLERKRVSERTEVTPDLAVFTFVEDDRHFYFVVGTGCVWRRSR